MRPPHRLVRRFFSGFFGGILLFSEWGHWQSGGFRVNYAQTAEKQIHTQKIACNLFEKSKKQV